MGECRKVQATSHREQIKNHPNQSGCWLFGVLYPLTCSKCSHISIISCFGSPIFVTFPWFFVYIFSPPPFSSPCSTSCVFYTQKYTFFPQPAWTTVSLSFTNTWSWRTSLTHSFDRSVCHWWSSCPLNSRTVASGDTFFWEEKTLGARSFVGFCGFPWLPKKTTAIVKESRNDSKGWEALQFLRESLTKTRFCI